MAIFKILKGDSSRISMGVTPFHEGYAYFTPDDGGFYIDTVVDNANKRVRINDYEQIKELIEENKDELQNYFKNYLNSYLTKHNPTGSGTFSLNRKEGTDIGNYSFAEGQNTTASGNSSHAEGRETIVQGDYSHAEGIYTISEGYASHAEGDNTIAKGDYSHVQGKYNIEDTNDKYAMIIGNGTADDKRSNAFTVDWEGNVEIEGSLVANGRDIEVDRAALVNLINAGQKNLCSVNKTTVTQASSSGGYLFGTAASSYRMEIDLPAGSYTLTAKYGTGFGANSNLILYAAKEDGSSGSQVLNKTFTNKAELVYNFTLTSDAKYIQLFTNMNSSFTPFEVREIMICKRELYDIDSSYQPYAKSNIELTEELSNLNVVKTQTVEGTIAYDNQNATSIPTPNDNFNKAIIYARASSYDKGNYNNIVCVDLDIDTTNQSLLNAGTSSSVQVLNYSISNRTIKLHNTGAVGTNLGSCKYTIVYLV